MIPFPTTHTLSFSKNSFNFHGELDERTGFSNLSTHSQYEKSNPAILYRWNRTSARWEWIKWWRGNKSSSLDNSFLLISLLLSPSIGPLVHANTSLFKRISGDVQSSHLHFPSQDPDLFLIFVSCCPLGYVRGKKLWMLGRDCMWCNKNWIHSHNLYSHLH